MKNQFTFITLLFFWFISFCIHAQMKPPTNSLSPTATGLGQYGDIPISYFTGSPQIDVPLYNITDGGIKLPLSLSYDASGIRVDQHPGPFGLNWRLLASGVINRKRNGAIDELAIADVQIGYYYKHGLTDVTNWDTKDYITYLANYPLQPNSYIIDSEPDEFSFQFLQYSGKFYLDSKGNWQVQSNQHIKVIFDNTFLGIPFKPPTVFYSFDNVHSFSGFTLITDDGTRYVFGGVTDAIEYSVPFFDQTSKVWTANSWYLTKIISIDGREIKFTYDSEKISSSLTTLNLRNEFHNAMYSAVNYRQFDLNNSTGGDGVGTLNCSGTPTIFPESGHYYGELIAPIYLSSIETSLEKINFHFNVSSELSYSPSKYYSYIHNWQTSQPGKSLQNLFPYLMDSPVDDYTKKLKWRQINNIECFNKGTNSISKTFNFSLTNQINKRLMLLSFIESSKSSNKTPYVFHYIDDTFPDYLTQQSDHWGFFNSRTPYPLDDVNNLANYYSTREPDAQAMTMGILDRITYPTGGRTEFIYEPHYYSASVKENRIGLDLFPTDQMAGGLRIRKVSSYSNNSNQPIIKEYFYVKGYSPSASISNFSSSGNLGGKAKYFWDKYVTTSVGRGGTYTQSLFSTITVLPNSNNSRGSHIGYSEVVEKLQDNSYVIYKYTNFDNGHLDEAVPDVSTLQPTHTIYEPYIDKSIERGELISKESYNSNSALVQKSTYTYQPISLLSENFIKSIYLNGYNACVGELTPQTNIVIQEGYAFKYYYYKFKMIDESSYQYDQNDIAKFTFTKNTYQYNIYGFPTQIQTFKSDNTLLTSMITYPLDYPAVPNATGPSVLELMQGKNMLNYPINTQKISRRNGINSFIKSNLNIYQAYNTNNNIKISSVLDFPNTNNSSVSPLIVNTDGSLSFNNQYRNLFTVNSYDNFGNVLEQKKANDIPVCYLWAFNNTYIIAEIKNATLSLVLAALGNISRTDLDSYSVATIPSADYLNRISGLRAALNNAMVSTFTYIPLTGMTSKIDENNVITYFEYDDFRRLKLIRDQDNNILKMYCYNYSGQIEHCTGFKSPLISSSFKRNNCVSGLGGTVTYTVPAGKYSSDISMLDAVNKAINDLTTNGQAYANANGTCL